MRNAWGSSDDTPTTSLGKVVRIKTSDLRPLPHSTNLAKQIRNSILRDEFDYTDAEIADFNTAHPADAVIEDKRFPNKWATDSQIKNWKAGTDGLVPITLEESWVKAVNEFRDQRILINIYQAAGAITDFKIQRAFIDDLNKILKSDSKERLDALRNLMTLASGVLSTNKGISEALSYLAAQGYEDNPLIQIARAKALALNGGNNAKISTLLNEAVKNTSNRYSSSPTRKPISTLNGEEAAYINQEASYMFAQLGNDKEFQDRDWTARFYAMSAQEKSSYKAGDIVSLNPPGRPAAMVTPRPLTAAQKKFDKVESDMSETRRQWNEIDGGRQIVETTDPEAGNSGLVTLNREVTVESKVWDRKDGNKPPQQSRPNIYTRQENISQPLNQASMDRANAVGGGLALFLEAGKWVTVAVRMQAITEYLNKRDKLLRQIQNEMTHVVPDKPQIIEKLISRIREYARMTNSPAEKKQAQTLIDRLGLMLEESYAFYGKK